MNDREFWSGRRVLVTGHTGFKGGWLVAWLLERGARVTGLALAPVHPHGVFRAAGLEGRMSSQIGDVRQRDVVDEVVRGADPEVVFHLAAQPIVLDSFRDPITTLETNVMGTARVLEAVRATPAVRAVVVVTSDKCYDPGDRDEPHREGDALGGPDPYSASKAAAELIARSWDDSFFRRTPGAAAIATVRAGNVIGGGDWSAHRLVPDAVRARLESRALTLRYPAAVRPWQHVLEPLSGYARLARRLVQDGAAWSGPWNFGPANEDLLPVRQVVERFFTAWGGAAPEVRVEGPEFPENPVLRLDSTKARVRLGWAPRLDVGTALEWTAEWYRRVTQGEDAWGLMRQQLEAYERRSSGM